MLKRALIIFSFFCMVSCEYTPSKEYSVDLNPVPFGNITINLMEQSDTIIILKNSKLSYNILANKNQSVYSTIFKINDDIIESNSGTKGDFYLSPSDLETGIYKLKVDVTTSSGTGSLADIVGGEVLYYSKSWNIIIDKSNPEPLEITKIEKVDGQLRIEWQKNESYNFKSYEIKRTYYPYDDNGISSSLNTTVTDADKNWNTDIYYIGGEVIFNVENNNIYSKNVPGISKSFYSENPKIKTIGKSKSGLISLTWNKCLYENNFGKYELYNKTSLKPIFTSSKINDTSYNFSLPFGEINELKLITYSKLAYYDSNEKLTYPFSLYAGDSIPRYIYMVHSSVPNMVYFVCPWNIINYSLVENKIISSINSTNSDPYGYPSLIVSPNGEILAYFKDHLISILDPVTLETIKIIDLNNYFGLNFYYLVSITNNGLFTLGKSSDKINYSCGVFDINLNDTVFTFKDIGSPVSTSLNCKYIALYKKGIYILYNFTNPPVYIGEITNRNFYFNPENEEELYYAAANSIELYKCSDLKPIDQYKHNLAASYSEIDPISGKILLRNILLSTNIYQALIADFQKKTIVNTKQIFNPYDHYFQYTLFNNEIYSSRGYKISIAE